MNLYEDERKAANKAIKKLEKRLSVAKDYQEAIRSELPLHSPCCGIYTPIRELTFLQTKYYEEPVGCMGGDYWTYYNNIKFICPKCNNHVRILWKGEYYIPDNLRKHIDYNLYIQFRRKYMLLFKEVIEEYEKGYVLGERKPKFVNKYMDKEFMKLFELKVKKR